MVFTQGAVALELAVMSDDRELLRKVALDCHEHPNRGKLSVVPTKPLVNQRDLDLANAPGVAAACEEIAADPTAAFCAARRHVARSGGPAPAAATAALTCAIA